MHIRGFSLQDQEQVIALWESCGLLIAANNPHKDIARKLNVGADLFLVGEKNGQIIATAMGGYEGHRGWVNYLAVSPEYRGRGYGAQILGEVEGKIQSKGCAKINVQIRETNTDVVSFYNTMGYKQDKVISMGKRLERD